MKIENPKVTLTDEARNGVEEAVRSGFLDWLFEFNVAGDDGELYGLGGSILSLAVEKLDLVTMCYCKGTGTVRQLRNSIYKVGAYPQPFSNSRPASTAPPKSASRRKSSFRLIAFRGGACSTAEVYSSTCSAIGAARWYRS